MDGGSWQATVRKVTESDMTEVTSCGHALGPRLKFHFKKKSKYSWQSS